MSYSQTQSVSVEALELRIAQLEERVSALESRPGRASSAPSRGSSAAGAVARGSVANGQLPGWTRPYEVAQLELDQTWIEMHESSARRQLHRLIRECVAVEGPVTDGLLLRRVREAWGIKRAGARIQEVFDQAIKQLVHNENLERFGDAVIARGQELAVVRVPSADEEQTKRAVDEIGERELALALRLFAADSGAIGPDELTAAVARIFGWTRRGTEIQQRLDHVLERAIGRGELVREGSSLRAG